ncbi:nuclear transport factor 2 family protein [Maribacter polysaccharolyticus]|uniref:nuclear transport factor 2 family protein n=1 Tax=Maribacter polysaccharolyticus TaxID=3020831 RepID=UPI00237F40C0|nr:nuclear transport factor 2 family protein [Maribacter polysaccharolyticus]MDE3741117.1 nuclear transport factor 2 family protein [Maribacter polysaccharolyticus]
MKAIKFFNYAFLLFIFFSNPLFSQKADNPITEKSLKYEILKMDSLFFNVAFNKCDLELYKKIMSPNIEFYDDRSGLNTSFDVEIASFNDRCSRPFAVTRQLVNATVHVLGDYGAVEMGIHEFYEDGKKVQRGKFIIIWERNESSWIIKRTVSYDHEPV